MTLANWRKRAGQDIAGNWTITGTERCLPNLPRLYRDAHISALPIETDTERMGFPKLPRLCRYAAQQCIAKT